VSKRITRKRILSTSACLLVVFAVGLTIRAYAPALDAGFVFDDEPNITDSPAVHWAEISWANITRVLDSTRLQARPVANFSFALDHLAWGLDPAGYHLTNLLIHLGVGAALLWLCVLYARLAATPQAVPPARATILLAGAALTGLYLLHPLNTQAVTYVVQRMASMAALFSLLAFASYLMARYQVTARSSWWYAAAVLLWVLALGSKENAVLALPLVGLYELCFFRGEWQDRFTRLTGIAWNRSCSVYFWVVACAAATLAASVLVISMDSVGLGKFAARDFSGLERLLTQTRVQILYLSLLLWPSPDRLNLDHDFMISRGLLEPATTLAAAALCLALLSTAVMLAVRRPRYGFPVLAYILLHSLESGPVSLELVYEHRAYLPSTMLVLLGSTGLADISPVRRHLIVALLAMLYLPAAYWTHERNLVWADPLALQADIVSKSPDKARAHHNYALALREDGRSADALAIVRRAIELDPGDDRPYRLLGDILLDLERPTEALQAFRQALQVKPSSVAPVLGIGRAQIADGREDVAFRHYLAAGTDFGQQGSAYEAIMVLQAAIDLRPEDADALHALGSAYLLAGKQAQAADMFRAALRADPAKYESWYNLAIAAEALDLIDEAVDAYQRFIDLAPPELRQPILQAKERLRALKGRSSN
jgi:tetratricopeptide (TPR) repeat protein